MGLGVCLTMLPQLEVCQRLHDGQPRNVHNEGWIFDAEIFLQTWSLLVTLMIMPHSPCATALVYSDATDYCSYDAEDDGDEGLGGV